MTDRTEVLEAQGYDFTHKGKKYHLPPASKVKAGAVRKALKEENEMEAMFILIEGIAEGKTLEAIYDMPMDELGELFAEWQKAAGVGVGESDA